jgi:hypothetical protein
LGELRIAVKVKMIITKSVPPPLSLYLFTPKPYEAVAYLPGMPYISGNYKGAYGSVIQ